MARFEPGGEDGAIVTPATTSCSGCNRRFGPGVEPTTSLTGRRICTDCADGLTAAAVGAALHPEAPVPAAIATEGWFRRLRLWRRRGMLRG